MNLSVSRTPMLVSVIAQRNQAGVAWAIVLGIVACALFMVKSADAQARAYTASVMWPISPGWRDPLASSAPGTVFKSGTGLRVRQVGLGGATLVFIHGLGGSLRYWGTAYDRLAETRRLIFVDLLGFGGSDKPSASYDLRQHSRIVGETLEEMAIQQFSVVGHSTGSAVAMHLAATSDSVSNVVAFAAPIFPSEEAARRHLARLGPLERSMAEGTELAVRMCRFMCNHRCVRNW